jgi:hypothetical protein
MNEVQLSHEELKEQFAAKIIQAKARFIHIALAAIMPKELYELAAADNQIQRCSDWAKAQGYEWEEGPGETRLKKGPIVVGRFRPVMQGTGEKRHCVFYANIMGQPVNVVVDNPLINAN